MHKINYSIAEKGMDGVTVITSKVVDGGREENINTVKAYWDENHQIFLEIQENGISRIIKTTLFKEKADLVTQSSFCEISIDVLCKAGGSIICKAACLALREIPVIGAIFNATTCTEVCTSIVNEGCNGTKTKLCKS
ncbi:MULTISPECIES: hypothetical protein [Bacillota]|uniref:hypothetical protein n=1 Tax=Bacillota TaxID=1239 RepID=UPI0002EB1C9A|nr:MULTISPECIES: hypothetical protein [Bacillota]NRG29482.1 hypothetical protein [Niallia circulans]